MTPIDRAICEFDRAVRAVAGIARAARPSPAAGVPEQDLGPSAREHAAALMRVNHVGEVCAQALYQGQALTARSDHARDALERAAREEEDHLAWSADRIRELQGRPSLLNPLWYAGAFGIGLLAGRAGDAVSLAFLVETERQVEQHLETHLDRLPPGDRASRAIVSQMKTDETAHATAAQNAGATALPLPVRWAMRAAARVMTATAHYV